MAWLQRPDQAVQEPSAPGRALAEQPVHLRSQPDGRHALRDGRLGAGGLVIQAEHPPLRRAVRRGAGAEPQPVGELRRHAPAAGAALARQVCQAGIAQSTPWDKE